MAEMVLLRAGETDAQRGHLEPPYVRHGRTLLARDKLSVVQESATAGGRVRALMSVVPADSLGGGQSRMSYSSLPAVRSGSLSRWSSNHWSPTSPRS